MLYLVFHGTVSGKMNCTQLKPHVAEWIFKAQDK